MIKVENLVAPSAQQFTVVINGMRNAYKSYDRADSGICVNSEIEKEICYECPYVDHWEDEAPYSRPICYIDTYENEPVFVLGKNDRKLAENLISGDSPSHRKFLRQLPLVMDITAPLYFWKQLDTYKIGTTANSESTMHTLTKNEFKLKDFSVQENSEDFLPQDVLGQIVIQLNVWRDIYLKTKDKRYWHAINEFLPQSYNQKRTWTANYEVLLTIINQRIYHPLSEWRDLIIFWLLNIPYLLEFALADGVIKKKDSDVVINNKKEEVLFSLK